MSSKGLAAVVAATPELQQNLKRDLLWQLQLGRGVKQEQVSSVLHVGAFCF